MRQPLFFSFICALLIIASSNALASERDRHHHHKGKSEYREGKRHDKKHRREHRREHRHSHHYNKQRKHKHRRHNDAAIFIGGALLGAAINSHHNHRHGRHSYSYRQDRRGDCFRIEYRDGREVWFAVPRQHCRVY